MPARAEEKTVSLTRDQAMRAISRHLGNKKDLTAETVIELPGCYAVAQVFWWNFKFALRIEDPLNFTVGNVLDQITGNAELKKGGE